jgi:hypothetical protein
MTAKGWHQRKHKRTSSKGKKFDAGRFVGKRGVTIKLAQPYGVEFVGEIKSISGDNAVISDWTYGSSRRETIDIPKKAILSVKKPKMYTVTVVKVLDSEGNEPSDKQWNPTFGYHVFYPEVEMHGGVWETLDEVRKEILDTTGIKTTVAALDKKLTHDMRNPDFGP